MAFGRRGPYRFQEWVNLSYLRKRNTVLFRVRYCYYYILLTYVCVHRLYLFSTNELSIDSRILHYDYSRILFNVPTRYIIYVSLLSSMYDSFYRYVFMINQKFVNPFLKVFCQHRRIRLGFSVKYFEFKRYNWICQRLYHWVSYGLLILWLAELMVFPFTIQRVYHIIESKEYPLRLVYWFCFIWNGYAFHHMLGMMSFVSTSGATFGLLYLFMLGNIFKNLAAEIQRRTADRKLLRWRRNYLQVMHFLFLANRILGASLTSVIVCGTPPHAYLLMYMISHPDMSMFDMANNIFSLCVISTYILFAHLYCSKFCDVVGQPAKVLFGHLSRERVNSTVRKRLLLSNLLVDIHSNQPYGFTYGSHGLICTRTFNRFLFIYIKFMIITYKLIFGSP